MKIANNSFINVSDKSIRDNKPTDEKIAKNDSKSSSASDGVDTFVKSSTSAPVKGKKDYDESSYDGATAGEKLADVKSSAQGTDYTSLLSAHDSLDPQKVIALLA